jgi:hypothetical protein
VHHSLHSKEKFVIGLESQPSAEAEVIRRRREAVIPPMSRRQAATKAGVSPSQWSDVERGHKRAGPGIIIPVHASAWTLARMAEAVDATANELTAAGRDDAARLLQTEARRRLLGQRLAAVPGLGVIADFALPGGPGTGELLPLIVHGLEAIRTSRLTTRAKQELTSLFADNLLHDATRRYNELLLMLRLAERGSRPD